MNNYWIVGAMWGTQDMCESFLLRGYWCLGWKDEDKPEMAKKRNKIKKGDRIAIKQMLGKGSKYIRIKVIGIVKDVDRDLKLVFINWIPIKIDREVDCHGCFDSIRGPYCDDNDWIKEIFHI